ncbi:MAG: hypothetical protein JST35_01005 [Armatimonadetes bacterium]|jgi:hypothetical protein|nr:hypothetical protein [Armatimonadota bacterium]
MRERIWFVIQGWNTSRKHKDGVLTISGLLVAGVVTFGWLGGLYGAKTSAGIDLLPNAHLSNVIGTR